MPVFLLLSIYRAKGVRGRGKIPTSHKRGNRRKV